MKLFLLGFMGSGKSTAGRRLAKKINFSFLDLDEHIEKDYGKSVAEIFETQGEVTFRELEQQYLKSILDRKNTVIALGGGTPCYHNNMELINSNGISLYFKMSIDSLTHRLLNARVPRPLIQGKSESDLKTFIGELLLEREIFYHQANYIIKAKNLKVEELAMFINEKIIHE